MERKEEALKRQIDAILETLSPKERKVLELRFGLRDGKARTLADVGREFALSPQRISQIQTTALRKMRYSPQQPEATEPPPRDSIRRNAR